jgi:glutamate synthase (NADPH/NADH) small chain
MVLKNGYGQQEARSLFGDITRYTATATGFFGQNGHVAQVEVSEVSHFQPIDGTQKRIKADLVLLAMGFTGAEQWLFDEFGITDKHKDYTTNDGQLFVAGDCRRGPSLVIWGFTKAGCVPKRSTRRYTPSLPAGNRLTFK